MCGLRAVAEIEMKIGNTMSDVSFALIGAAGYIAPKHMKAMTATGGKLVVAFDQHDSVGVLDSHFPNASFFTEFERFDRHLEKLRRTVSDAVQYVAVCSPNYLHDAHCRLALRIGADAICEKPLVINPWNLDQLRELEQEYGKRIYTVLQLRLHPAVVKLREEWSTRNSGKKAEVCLTYITRRGRWYHNSWKGDEARSGGLAMNIGVHFFDFLIWTFGRVQRNFLNLRQSSRMSGVLELERARIKWFLSIDENDLPAKVREDGGYAYRAIDVDGQEMDLSAGFVDLHSHVYQSILSGDGFGTEAAQSAIDLVYQLRNSSEVPCREDSHPYMLSRDASVILK